MDNLYIIYASHLFFRLVCFSPSIRIILCGHIHGIPLAPVVVAIALHRVAHKTCWLKTKSAIPF